jgi:hypothetical protein
VNADQLCVDVTRVFGTGFAIGCGVGMLAGYLWRSITGRQP